MTPKLALILLLAVTVHAEDSDLVKAAKRKPSTKKPITNEDVKKNATKSGGATGNPPAIVHEKSELALQDERNRARAMAERLVKAREERVALLEKELVAIELSYYDASDLDARDRDITRKFKLTKEKLETARQDLTAARAEEAALAPKAAIVRP
jgi:hypothetical protein